MAGLNSLHLPLNCHDHRPSGNSRLVHGRLRARIVQVGLCLFGFIPFKDQSNVVWVFHIAIELVDTRRASRLSIGFIGIEASAPLVVISDMNTEIDVDHKNISFLEWAVRMTFSEISISSWRIIKNKSHDIYV